MFLLSMSSDMTMPQQKRSALASVTSRGCSEKVFVFSCDHLAFLIVHRVESLGDSEVGKFFVAFLRNHNVFRIGVPMNDSQGPSFVVGLEMGIAETPANSGDDENGQVGGSVLVGFDMPFQKLFEVPSGDEFHRHEILLANLPQMVGLNDIRVDQISHQLGFADEIVPELLNGRVFLPNQLDRDDLAETTDTTLGGLVNHAHSAFGDFSGKFVVNFVENMFH